MSNKKFNKVFIHQPDFAPWTTFFKRLDRSDVYIVLDDIQYNRRGLINKDYFLFNKKKTLLTIPVMKSDRESTLVKDVKIDYKSNWIKKIKNTIYLNYLNTLNFKEVYKFLDELFEKKYEKLIDMNLDIINYVMKKYKISTKIVFSSNLNISSKKSERILDICKKIKATHYITGEGSIGYLDAMKFNKDNILINDKIFFTKHYSQNTRIFIEDLSVFDMLFNIDHENAKKIIKFD